MNARGWRKVGVFILFVFILGLIIPQKQVIPVEGAEKDDYHPDSFWHYPWGKSITHKGVDIFAKKGTNVLAPTSGIVLYAGEIELGGKIILSLGPRWRSHYFAHLHGTEVTGFSWINKNGIIGTVGDSGNAAGKPPHLHYSIVTLLPYPWRIDRSRQGWKKMFYLNPIDFFE